MSQSKHTPAPWTIGDITSTSPGNGLAGRLAASIHHSANLSHPLARVAARDDLDAEEVLANARLIAAAPDLLAQLKHAIHWHDQLTAEDVARYMAVVDKAEGRS